MVTYQTRPGSATTLFRVAAAMHMAARRARAGGRRLARYVETRRAAALSLREPEKTSAHELFDIGLARMPLPRATWEAANRDSRSDTAPGGNAGSGNTAARTLVKCSLHLHIGLIGAVTFAVGLLQLFDHEAEWLTNLVLALCGCTLAVASWRRARIILERADPRVEPGVRS